MGAAIAQGAGQLRASKNNERGGIHLPALQLWFLSGGVKEYSVCLAF